jgi:hypothetical protein
MTPGFASSLRKSRLTSLGDFLSRFRARGKGMVEIKDFKKEGMESNREFNFSFLVCKKVVKSLYACGPPA